MLLGGFNHRFILALIGISGSGWNRAGKFSSLWDIKSCKIAIVVKTLLRLSDNSLTVVVSNHHVHNHIALALLVIHQEDIVSKVKFVIRIAQEVRFAGGEFFKLVDEIVAQSSEQPTGNTERFAGQPESKGYSAQYVHLVGCLKTSLLINQLLRLFDFPINCFGTEFD